MKTLLSSTKKQSGSILIIALLATSVVAIVLAGYLSMASNQYRITLRSQYWNSVMPTVEAGIEEALTHLNKNCVSNTVINQPVNFTADGWAQIAGSLYKKEASFGEGSYSVTIDFTDPLSPIIEAEGFVTPAMTSKSSLVQFATVSLANSSSAPIGRKVRVTVGRDNMIAKAMFAKGQIDLNGNNVETDSFDSSNPAYSTDGLYDPTKKKDQGDVATNSGLTNSVNVGNAKIHGSVSTGPGGSVAIGPNGTVGDLAWVNSGSTGIQPGRSTDDMNVYVPEVELPFSGGLASPIRNVTLTNPVVQWLLQTNDYATLADAQTAAATLGGTIYTNSIIATNPSHPSAGTYVGTVLVNTRITTNASYPATGTYVGGVTTNLNSLLSTNYPSTYFGVVATNFGIRTTTNFPTAGTYVGNVTTNYGSQTSTSYPSNPLGAVTTNTQQTATYSYPSSGSYLGTVTTNTAFRSNQRYQPAAGTYMPGTLSQRPNGRWDYYEITGYSYRKIVSYTYPVVASYTYQAIINYFYQVIRDYTYNLIVGYTYNQITDFSLVGRQSVTNYVVKFFNYVFDSADYEVDVLSGNVLVRGDARVHVTQSASFTGTDSIEINHNASLKLYVSAASASIKGNGVLNYTGKAENFYYYGLPSNTDVSIGGNGGLTGVIYAPQADFSLGGGGSSDQDFVGASITKSAKMNGHFHFHYDEDLRRSGPFRGYLITAWNEVIN